MKVHVGEMSTTIPVVGRVLNFLIRICLIPVTKYENCGFEMKIKSCKFVVTTLIWTFVPCTLAAYIYVPQIGDAFKQKTSIIASILVKIISYTSIHVFLPFCMGYLVSTVKIPLQELVVPSQKIVIMLITLADLTGGITAFASQPNIISAESVAAFIFTLFMTLTSSSALFIVNLFTTSLISKCKKLSEIGQTGDFASECKSLLFVYRSVKKGFGPTLLYMFTVHVTLMVSLVYSLTVSDRFLYYFFPFIVEVLFILTLCLICQECFDEFQATGDVIRWAYCSKKTSSSIGVA